MIAAADCTGHGVPGAMVSVVCSGALTRSVKEFGLTNPGKILDKTTELVLETLEKNQTDVKDGMDISLCTINPEHGVVMWSGANNPLWIVRTNEKSDPENFEFIEIKADKQPIGKFDNRKPFSTNP
jgi:serine phosphatase RsbU (regulator of sigma subunit)